MQMTVATTDGETLWAFRYSSEGRSRSLFHSTDISTLRAQYPDNPVLHRLSDDARLVVSEPLGGLRGAWREVPEGTCVVVRDGQEELRPFAPTVLGRSAERPRHQATDACDAARCPGRVPRPAPALADAVPTVGVEEEFLLLWPDGRTGLRGAGA